MIFRQSYVLLAALGLTQLTSAAVNLLSSAPACAQSCTALTSALQTCNQQDASAPLSTLASCFCVNTQATQLRTDPSVCASSCTSSSDQTNAMEWFANFCAAPQTITALPGAGATAAPIVGTSTQTTSGASATNTAVDNNSANELKTTDQGSWWDQHKKWIAMVVVLIAVFAIIIVLGICLKRRHTRKRQAQSTGPASAAWGPRGHQSHPSVDRLAQSNSTLDRDAEKGGYYQNRPMSTRVQSDRSVQRGSSRHRTHGQGSQKDGKRLRKSERESGR